MESRFLISAITRDLQPTQRLLGPQVRLVIWLAASILYAAMIIWTMSPRADLSVRLNEVNFQIELVASLLTAVLAGFTAFVSIIPGYSRRWLVLPFIPLGIWLISLSTACVSDFITLGMDGIQFKLDIICLPAIAMVGFGPAVLMVIFLKRGAPLTPRLSIFFGSLAAAAIGNFGLRFFHPQDASFMVLVWQFGSVMLLSMLGGLSGRYLLVWRKGFGRQ